MAEQHSINSYLVPGLVTPFSRLSPVQARTVGGQIASRREREAVLVFVCLCVYPVYTNSGFIAVLQEKTHTDATNKHTKTQPCVSHTHKSFKAKKVGDTSRKEGKKKETIIGNGNMPWCLLHLYTFTMFTHLGCKYVYKRKAPRLTLERVNKPFTKSMNVRE